MALTAEGLEEAMSPRTMKEWALAERGIKRAHVPAHVPQPVYTPAPLVNRVNSPTKLMKLSPSEDNPANQSDLDITFSAMNDALSYDGVI